MIYRINALFKIIIANRSKPHDMGGKKKRERNTTKKIAKKINNII
jgi:hypothetical protein